MCPGCPVRRGTACLSWRSRLPQDDINLVLQQQLLLLERFNGTSIRGKRPVFHVFNLLIQFVVALKQSIKVGVFGFERGNQIAKFWKHWKLLKQDASKARRVSKPEYIGITTQ